MKTLISSFALLIFCSFSLYAVNSDTGKKETVATHFQEQTKKALQKKQKGKLLNFFKKLKEKAESKFERSAPSFVNPTDPILALVFGAISFPVVVVGVNNIFDDGFSGSSLLALGILLAASASYFSFRTLSRLRYFRIPGLAAVAAILGLIFALPITILGIIVLIIDF